jgi:aconitate hydratase 2/2-methylisocitrate dehydratase
MVLCLSALRLLVEYLAQIEVVNGQAADIYRYMNFDQILAFVAAAEAVVT